MTIKIEINNPRLVAGLEDMAGAVGLDLPTLCNGLIEQQVNGYIRDVSGRKREAVGYRLTERLNRVIAENGPTGEDSE